MARASAYAKNAHQRIDHRRRYTLQPYDVHLHAVARLVAEVTDDAEMIAAAWLHDVVEDTPATFEMLEREFGPGVAGLVKELTDASRPGDGNRAARKAIDRRHASCASRRAKSIKLADVIDNCRDICRHDPRFGRVYIAEMMALLEVLREGDARLYAKAEAAVDSCAARLELTGRAALDASFTPEPQSSTHHYLPQRGLRLFSEAFTARDIAEPLLSFDAGAGPGKVRGAVGAGQVVGVRSDGKVVGYARVEQLADSALGEQSRAFDPQQVVAMETSLSDVIQVLTRFDFCFVSLLGQVGGVITRADIGKPIVRMWLFGMLTVIEMTMTDIIRATWPGRQWTSLLTERRLEKAELLFRERQRRNQSCDLLDCLQLSDKGQILLEKPGLIEDLGFPSRGSAKKSIKEIESLRNNLAHSQDITEHDWPQIARMTQRMELLLGGG